MSADLQKGRWRCCIVGCNPVLNVATAERHHAETGHRVAAWPVRSKEGQRRAKIRNKTGYYDKYNVGEKSAAARGIGGGYSVGVHFDDEYDEHPFSSEALGQS